jgi:hypothetical protein
MASTSDYELMYYELVSAFQRALKLAIDEDQSSRALKAMNAAFKVAAKYGWDWENDEKWERWANRATGPELAAHGLAAAITKCRL